MWSPPDFPLSGAPPIRLMADAAGTASRVDWRWPCFCYLAAPRQAQVLTARALALGSGPTSVERSSVELTAHESERSSRHTGQRSSTSRATRSGPGTWRRLPEALSPGTVSFVCSAEVRGRDGRGRRHSGVRDLRGAQEPVRAHRKSSTAAAEFLAAGLALRDAGPRGHATPERGADSHRRALASSPRRRQGTLGPFRVTSLLLFAPSVGAQLMPE